MPKKGRLETIQKLSNIVRSKDLRIGKTTASFNTGRATLSCKEALYIVWIQSHTTSQEAFTGQEEHKDIWARGSITIKILLTSPAEPLILIMEKKYYSIASIGPAQRESKSEQIQVALSDKCLK